MSWSYKLILFEFSVKLLLQRGVFGNVYLCCSFDPLASFRLASLQVIEEEKRGEKFSIFRLQDCRRSCSREVLFLAHSVSKIAPVCILCVCLFFLQTVLITTVHGWATVWARETTDTSTCSPWPCPCSPFTSSPSTSSTSSCVSDLTWSNSGPEGFLIWKWALYECVIC